MAMKSPLKILQINDLEVRVHSLNEVLGLPLAESVSIIDKFNDVSPEEAEIIFNYLEAEGFISSSKADLEVVKFI
jgi:hypothetical protein